MRYKQVIVIRDDTKMSRGKIATQTAHASHAAVRKARKSAVEKWILSGEKKVVLRAKDLKELQKIETKCKKMKVAYALVRDAGLTEVQQGTITAIGIGPENEDKVNKISGSLPLLK